MRHKGKFVSIKKDNGDEPMTIELDRSIELILAQKVDVVAKERVSVEWGENERVILLTNE